MSNTGQPPTRRTVPCPHCGTPTVYSTANPWRPFCSERCKSLDFGAWAAESYRVQARPDEADLDALEQAIEPPAADRTRPH